MIVLEVTESPDEFNLGKYETFYQSFLIGRSTHADLIIDDKDIEKIHLKFSTRGQDLLVSTLNNEQFYLFNDKKVFGSKIIRPGDTLTIGKTKIRLEAIIPMPDSNSQEVFNKGLEELHESGPDFIEVLETLENEILILDKEAKENV